jgi:hypothetical protein
VILGFLLAAAAAPADAVEAERAFAAMAQTQGQNTAFRAYAAPEAVMFTPQPVPAHDFLKGRPDPPPGLMWWPSHSYVSCDGRVAVNTGPWLSGGGRKHGYFMTVWVKQPDGSWRWVYDAGNSEPKPAPAGDRAIVVRPDCSARARRLEPPGPSVGPEQRGYGRSPDGSLVWEWTSKKGGERLFEVRLRDKAGYRPVLGSVVPGAERE